MTSWTEFAAAEPDFARRARSLLTATTNCVLGTIRADGSPRLCGIDPFFVEDRLLLGSMQDSRKAIDLRRDPRMSLHGIPWESRKVKEGAVDPGEGDVKVTGRAIEVGDGSEVAAIMDRYWADLGVDAPGPADLFDIDLETVVLVYVEDDMLVIDRWSASEGHKVVRRT